MSGLRLSATDWPYPLPYEEQEDLQAAPQAAKAQTAAKRPKRARRGYYAGLGRL